MDGILNINKPWGKTSFSIVAMVKRLSGERRAGHAGTLDPTATGVLPVCLGLTPQHSLYLFVSGRGLLTAYFQCSVYRLTTLNIVTFLIMSSHLLFVSRKGGE